MRGLPTGPGRTGSRSGAHAPALLDGRAGRARQSQRRRWTAGIPAAMPPNHTGRAVTLLVVRDQFTGLLLRLNRRR